MVELKVYLNSGNAFVQTTTQSKKEIEEIFKKALEANSIVELNNNLRIVPTHIEAYSIEEVENGMERES